MRFIPVPVGRVVGENGRTEWKDILGLPDINMEDLGSGAL